MKKTWLFSLMALIVAACCFMACDDDDDDTPEYYVRYTVGGAPNDNFFVSYADEKGENRLQQGKVADGKMQVVVGPVKCGFKASLAASLNNGNPTEYLQIEVSRNGHPFVQKVYLQQGAYTYYTITKNDR